jgi:hypothetical protein
MKYDEFFNVNDTYKIKKDLDDIKKLILEIEEDVNRFLGPNKPKIRGVKARSKITKLKNKLLPVIARKILKTKQDYDSDYS